MKEGDLYDTRNYLYNEAKEVDLFNRIFILDAYVLVTKKMNPFSLERKFFDVNNRKIACML